MKNLTFKAAMLKGSRPTVNRQSTDGQSQRHCKQTPLSKRWKVLMTLVFLFTFAIGNVWATCDPGTAIFEFAVKDGLTNGNIAAGNPVDLGSYVTVTTGSVSAYAKDAGDLTIVDAKAINIADKSNSHLNFALADGCAFQAGDIIKYIIYNKNALLQPATDSEAADKLTLTKTANITTERTVVIPTGHALVGKSTFYLYTGDNGCKIKRIEIIRPYTITLDATTNGGLEVDPVKGADGDKVILPHAFKKDTDPVKYYKFKGWYENHTGGEPVSNIYTVSEGKTLYAQFENIPTSGPMFTLQMESSLKPASSVDLKAASSTETVYLNLLQYATISGGAAVASTKGTSAGIQILTTPAIKMNGQGGCVKVDLDAPLQSGDEITAAGVSANIWFTNSDTRPSSAPSTILGKTSPTKIVCDGSNLTGQTFYIYYSGSGATFTGLTITRPATYTVTFNNNGHGGTAPDAQSGITSGGKATEPTDPVDDNYNFDGWYNKADWQADGAEKWNFGTSTVTKDTTLYAKWTDKSVPSTDATLSALSVAGCTFNETFDPATLAYTVDLPFYASMPTASAVTATKNDANASDPVVSVSGNVISVEVTPQSGAGDMKTYTITVTIAATPTASSSINIEQLILDNSTDYNIGAALDDAHIGYANKDDLDSLSTAAERNEPYLGLKFKSSSSTITIIVPANKTLKVKFGARKTTVKVAINDGAVSDASISNNIYSLAAVSAVRKVKFSVTENKKTIVLKQIMVGEDIKSVQLPWLVTYDAGEHGTCATAKETWKGSALTLPAVTPASGWDFEGWYDGETKITTSTYTPTADVTLVAHYTAQAAGTDLQTLTYQIGAGAATNVGYTAGYYTYNIELPYKPSYDAITVNVTPVTGASVKDDATKVLTVSSLPGAATFTVTDGVSEQLYTVNFKKAAKDGICIIKATPTSGTEATADGLYKGNAYFKGRADDKKLNTNGEHYVGVALASGYTFQSGDEVRLNQVAEVNGTTDLSKIYLYKEVPTGDNLIVTLDNTGVQGDNVFAMPSEFYGESALYIGRKDANCNPTVGYLAVYRAMNPELMAIKINGRDGEIDPLDDKHFYVTIPYEADLAALTVVPTIVSNTAEASVIKTVESNDGAWVLAENGDNTYRIKDKDGDYTDYTITLTRDVLKHAVKFYDGETLLETVEVVDGVQMAAGDVPANPTKEDYVFQGWAESTTGDVVDVTSFTISATKNFYAKWEAEVAYRLIIDDTPSGKKINNVDFYTGVSLVATPVNIGGYNYYYTKVAGGAGSDNTAAPSGVTYNKDRVIAYNAKTTETKIKVTAYNKTTSNRSFRISFVEEGEAPADVPEDNVTIALPKDYSILNTDYYEFNSNKNRTIYITVPGSVDDCYFLQVKVVESGEDLKKAGEVGYSLNLNKGRMVGAKQVDQAGFEGFDFHYNNAYELLKSTSMVLNVAANDFIKFHAAAPMTLVVSADNAGVFHVTKDAKGTHNETTAVEGGTVSVDLNAAGDWYLTPKGGDVKITNIAFLAPKCEQPTVADMANSDLCEGDAFAELTVNASVNDEGTLHYAWYKEAGETDEAVGSDAATFTPEADGQYYVIVTNHKDNFTDNSKTSNTITVAHFASAQITTAPADQYKEAGQNATLTVAASGKAPLSYQWYTCDENGDNAVIIAGAEAESYQVAVTAGMSQYYKVIVGSGCGSAEAVAKVAEWTEKDPANVTGSMTWDWKSAAWNGITDNIEFENTSVEQLMANVNAKVPCVDGENGFRSDMLYGTGQFVWRSSNKFFQGTKIRFITTVPGRLTVRYRNTSGSENTRTIKVTNNGEVLPADGTNTTNSFKNTNPVLVAPGEVIIEGIASETNGLTRIEKIVFNAQADEERNVVIGNMGTVCLPNPSRAFGVNVYELAGKGEGCKVQFDQLGANEVLEAGKAYVLVMTDTKAKFFYTSDETADADWSTAMKGNLSATPIEFQPYDEAAKNVVFFKDNAMWNAYETGLRIKQYRAYLQYDEVTEPANSQPAPGRRRVSLNLNGAQVATGFDNLEASEAPMKVMIDGQLFIIRGEKMFDATGRLVK